MKIHNFIDFFKLGLVREGDNKRDRQKEREKERK